MKQLLFLFAIITLSLSKVLAGTLPPCLGGESISTFRLLLQAEGKSPALPLSSVNIIEAGEKLKYEPIHVPIPIKDKAQVAILLVPVAKPSTEKAAEEKDKSKDKQKDLVVLEARPAKSPTEWVIPARTSIVGVVFGPHGLDVKKVSSLVEKNEDLIPELADYAQKTATVEALVQMLSKVEESPTPGQDLNAALSGFSAEYSVGIPRLDTAAPTNQQAGSIASGCASLNVHLRPAYLGAVGIRCAVHGVGVICGSPLLRYASRSGGRRRGALYKPAHHDVSRHRFPLGVHPVHGH